ncbi:MAG: 1-acyl-sn-glycerol-3-phosphate acyltransferase [Rhabdochlamydiaceae bacterium]
MDNFSIFEQKVHQAQKEGALTEKVTASLLLFFHSYVQAARDAASPDEILAWFNTFFKILRDLHQTLPTFQPYHAAIRSPFDYYTFGNDFLKHLVDRSQSTILGHDYLKEIQLLLKKGHNVVFLANHQIEADPQALSVLLDDHYPGFAEKMIFIAGERVITDPVAIPFSLGRHLLCIYSKRYIDHPPEKKMEKQTHNKRVMELMSLLLKEGGKAIYVAPSGGRDRRSQEGVVEVAPFDAGSIELFYLMAQKAGTPTHFYPMSLVTYDVLPPPETIQIEVGEMRHAGRAPIHLAIGPELNMKVFPGSDVPDKKSRRSARANYIWNQVNNQYQELVR